MTDTIPESLKPISWVAGRWTSDSGLGQYPNIKDFEYHDVIEFTCIGQPMFNFMSLSKQPETGKPMHQERGFLRIQPGTNNLAFVVSHNFGMTSVEEGVVDLEKKEIILESTSVSRMSISKAPHVKKIKRVIKLLDLDSIQVIISMETDTTPMCQHLSAVYKKE